MPVRINIPPVTRAVLGALVLQSFLSAAIRYRQWTSSTSEIVIPYLTLVPQLSLLYPWTFVTTTLVENNIFTIAIAGATLYYGCRYLERAWSSAELAKFLVITALIPNLLTLVVLVVLFTLSRNERWTLTVINGTVSLQIAFLVAFSQLVPAHTVTLFRGILSMRVPRFPLLYLGVITVMALSPLLSIASFFQAVFGFVVSWTYLRFYKKVFPDLDSSQPTSLRGDASETFAFAEFFPGPVKPFVAAATNQIFEVLVAMKVCTPFSQHDMPGRGGSYIHRTVPGSARAEAERRRALALKTLDQRLHAATGNTAGRPSSSGANNPPPTSGPTVHTQPQPNTQTAMTSQPNAMLGETNYTPDHDETHDGKNGS